MESNETKSTKRTRTLAGVAAAGAIALMLGGAILYPQVTQAQDATATPAAEEATPAAGQDAAGRFGRGEMGGDNGTALADALGITADELQAAYEEAAQAALDQAVEAGLITQAQADALAERGLGRGLRLPLLGGMHGELLGDIDPKALLADALGISADELQAAQDEAEAATLAAAVEAGNLTQEQADAIQAERDLREYIAPRIQTALDEAVAAAVEEGIVTQEQADAFLQGGLGGWGRGGDVLRGFGGMDGMFGERGGHGGHGGHDGRGGRGGHGEGGDLFGSGLTLPGTQPDATPETTTQGQGG